MRELDNEEWEKVLSDWSARARIYGMSPADPATVRRHEQAIVEMRELRSLTPSAGARKVVLALFQGGEVTALAGGAVSYDVGLVLSSIIVHPATLNDPQSNNAFKILVAARVFAKVLELQVDMSPLKKDGREPISVAVARKNGVFNARGVFDAMPDGRPEEATPDGTSPEEPRVKEGIGGIELDFPDPPEGLKEGKTWTRFTSKAQQLQLAVAFEDFDRAAALRKELEALDAAEESSELEAVAVDLEAAIAAEDYDRAFELKSALDEAADRLSEGGES
jgi:hypothetical protein